MLRDATSSSRARTSNVGPLPAPRVRASSFYNTSALRPLKPIADDPTHVGEQPAAPTSRLLAQRAGGARQVRVRPADHRLDGANLLYQVVGKFADIDLHPEVVSNHEMGYVFEELIRRFAEQSNETAGEHFTPREVIRLMVNLLIVADDDALTKPGVVRTMLRPGLRHRRHAHRVAEDHITRAQPGRHGSRCSARS